MEIKEQITAALKKLGPVSPGALADHLGIDRGNKLGYHLKAMLDAGELKASGSTINRRIALPDQKIEDAPPAPPQRGTKKKKSKARAATASRKARKPRAPKTAEPAPAPEGDFIAAVTADSRLVLFVPGQRPLVFNDGQTEAIAELCFANFKE